MGEHKIEIENQLVLVNDTRIISAQTYSDGTTVKPLLGGSTKGWLIQAPRNAGGRAEIKLKCRAFPTHHMLAGYIFDIFVKIPKGHKAGASGLCTSPTAGELPNGCKDDGIIVR